MDLKQLDKQWLLKTVAQKSLELAKQSEAMQNFEDSLAGVGETGLTFSTQDPLLGD